MLFDGQERGVRVMDLKPVKYTEVYTLSIVWVE